MKKNLSALILLFLSIESYAMHTTVLPKQEFCLYKNVNEGEKLNINYISSGQDEKKMMLRV